jgi:uncharacterized protein (TIGR00369 family)
MTKPAGPTGLEYIRSFLTDGAAPPPMARHMGFELTSADVGRAVFTCVPTDAVLNTMGTVHGGYFCALLDSATGCAGQTVLEAGRSFTTVEIKVSYVRPVRLGSGRLTAVGTVVKSGSRLIFTEGTVTDESGGVVATASCTLLAFDLS